MLDLLEFNWISCLTDKQYKLNNYQIHLGFWLDELWWRIRCSFKSFCSLKVKSHSPMLHEYGMGCSSIALLLSFLRLSARNFSHIIFTISLFLCVKATCNGMKPLWPFGMSWTLSNMTWKKSTWPSFAATWSIDSPAGKLLGFEYL